jgi:tetratricopeptide (TPR) repeat protein
MSQRLSRKQIKRDEFMESLGNAFDWVQDNVRILVGIGLGLIIALIVVVVYLGYADRRAARADEALAAAMRIHQAPIDPVAANPEDAERPTFADSSSRALRAEELFTQVVADYGRSDAARIATVYLGQIAADAGDLETARQHWQQAATKGGENALTAEVQVNLMSLDRAQGRGDELVTRLRALLSGTETELPPDLLWYQLGVTLEELDRQGEANEAFQRLLEEYPQSAFAPAARERTGTAASPLFGS